MLPSSFVFIDLETTGGNAQRERITEIGLLRVENGKLIDTWSTLVNPQKTIPPFISDFTGITNEMVADAPLFADICQTLSSYLEDAIFVAHNARFDYSFIKSEFRKQGISFTAKTLCTAKLSRRLYPEFKKHNLDSIMERHHIICKARHRALGDAEVLWEFWQKLHQQWSQEELEKEVNILLKKPTIPLNLPQEELDQLPEEPGVYQFYGKDGELLYIGKSINIRSRVLSHFSADHSSNKEMRMAQKTHHMNTITTGGELGALLKEAQLIKTHAPIFNRQLRRHRSLNSFRVQNEKSDYLQLELVQNHDLDPHNIQELYGLFRNKPSAKKALQKIAEEQQLCQLLLGLEKGSGPCFAYQLKKCKGACIGEEPASEFNKRLSKVLQKLRFSAWPYPGPIAITEVNQDSDTTEVHIVDNWCHLRTCSDESELYETLEDLPQPQFDLDIYKILKRAFRKGMVKPFQIKVLPRVSSSSD